MKPFKTIRPPKFRIGRWSLNEYELRCLLVDISNGEMQFFVNSKIIDSFGDVAYITSNGTLSERLKGMEVNVEFAKQLVINKLKNHEQPQTREN